MPVGLDSQSQRWIREVQPSHDRAAFHDFMLGHGDRKITLPKHPEKRGLESALGARVSIVASVEQPPKHPGTHPPAGKNAPHPLQRG